MIEALLSAIVIVIWTALATVQGWRLMQFLQIEEYINLRFLTWVGQNFGKLYLLTINFSVALLFVSFMPTPPLILRGLYSLLGAILLVVSLRQRAPVKKPLVYTPRVKRMLGVMIAFQVLLGLGFGSLIALLYPESFWQTGLWLITLALGSALVLVAANVALYPLEEHYRQNFVRAATLKVRKARAQVIAIAGSYGKTSTKEITSHILSSRFAISKVPKSYNTLMGLCRIINSREVDLDTDWFIAEMDSYARGEISKMCQMMQPKIAVLTSVGPMHLDRFKTIYHTQEALFEAIQALPTDGLAVFNADNELCYHLAQQTIHVPVVLYGIDHEAAQVAAEELRVSAEGTHFTLVDRRSGERIACKTEVLGRHTVLNVLAASVVAIHCGVPLERIARSVSALSPVPHRLELKQRGDGITVLDDAYNCNPEGARNALEVLSQFNGGKRILVTPGMVELGSVEYDENVKLGQEAAKSCDVAILIGEERADWVKKGMLQEGFTPAQIYRVPSLHAAQDDMARILQAGDTMLLLNDLPDVYEFAGIA